MERSEDTGQAQDIVVDVLYGEAERDSAELSDAERSELEGFEQVRALFSELPDEEPPSSLTAKLMAAAAQEAPRAPAEQGRGFFAWLADLMAPMARHPGLAAAASLVLVAGIAGTLWVTGGGKLSQPDVETARHSPAKAEAKGDAPAAEETAPGGSIGGSAGDVATEPTEEPTEETAGSAYADEDDTLAEGAAPASGDGRAEVGSRSAADSGDRSAAKERARPARRKRGLDNQALGFETESKKQNKSAGPARVRAGRIKGAVDLSVIPDSVADAPADEPAPAPNQAATPKPAPPAAAPAPDPSRDKDEAKLEQKPQQKIDPRRPPKTPASGSKLKSLLQDAITAAKGGDCPRALSLGRQIRAQDADFYRRQFVTSAPIKACLSSTQRKRKVRRK